MRTRWIVLLGLGVPIVSLVTVALIGVGLFRVITAPTHYDLYAGGPATCDLRDHDTLLVAVVPLRAPFETDILQFHAGGAHAIGPVRYGWLHKPASSDPLTTPALPTAAQVKSATTGRYRGDLDSRTGSLVLAAPVRGNVQDIGLQTITLVAATGEPAFTQDLALDIRMVDGKCVAASRL